MSSVNKQLMRIALAVKTQLTEYSHVSAASHPIRYNAVNDSCGNSMWHANDAGFRLPREFVIVCELR